MELDKEVSGNGNSYTTQFRQYDPRLGRWKSLDPLAGKYASQSPFVAFNNNPIYFTDPLGLEGKGRIGKKEKGSSKKDKNQSTEGTDDGGSIDGDDITINNADTKIWNDGHGYTVTTPCETTNRGDRNDRRARKWDRRYTNKYNNWKDQRNKEWMADNPYPTTQQIEDFGQTSSTADFYWEVKDTRVARKHAEYPLASNTTFSEFEQVSTVGVRFNQGSTGNNGNILINPNAPMVRTRNVPYTTSSLDLAITTAPPNPVGTPLNYTIQVTDAVGNTLFFGSVTLIQGQGNTISVPFGQPTSGQITVSVTLISVGVGGASGFWGTFPIEGEALVEVPVTERRRFRWFRPR